jgi:hypothetical protein
MIIRDFRAYGDDSVDTPVPIDIDPVPTSVDVSLVDIPTGVPSSILMSASGVSSAPSSSGSSSSSSSGSSIWSSIASAAGRIIRSATGTTDPAYPTRPASAGVSTEQVAIVIGISLLGGLVLYKVAHR